MSGSRQVTHFEDWSKQQEPIMASILGQFSEVVYINSVINRKIMIRKNHGKIFLTCEISKLNQEQIRALENKLDKEDTETPSDEWGYKTLAYQGQYYGYFDIKLTHTRTDDIEKLISAVNICAEFAFFPGEMVDDILLEIKNAISNHKEHMEKVTKFLMDDNFQTKNEIQKAYSVYNARSPSCNHAMAWIHTLMQESRYHEAIIWCDTFSTSIEPKRIILHCLMKLKDAEEKANKKSQLEEKASTGLDEDENIFVYLEKLFKCSWEIAKITNKEEDISLTLHYLDELSGGSGLERAYINIKSLDEVDILIQRARTIRELREDNTQSYPSQELREEIAKLKLENSRVSEENNCLKAEVARLRGAQLQSNSVTPSSPRPSQSRDVFMPAVQAENVSQSDIESSATENRYFQNQN